MRVFGKIDSLLLKGTDIYRLPVIEDDYSPWRQPGNTYWKLDDRYLLVVREESNIGETFQFFKRSYLVYESVH